MVYRNPKELETLIILSLSSIRAVLFEVPDRLVSLLANNTKFRPGRT